MNNLKKKKKLKTKVSNSNKYKNKYNIYYRYIIKMKMSIIKKIIFSKIAFIWDKLIIKIQVIGNNQEED